MARLRCPKCGNVFEADPQVARCPRCAWAPPGRPQAPVAAGAPASSLPPLSPPAAPPADGPPSRLAVWALVCALAPVATYLFSFALEASFARSSGEPNPFLLGFGGFLGLVGLAGPIAAIVLGITARRSPGATQKTRGMALAAIIVGSVILGLYVLMALFILLLVAVCASACSNSSSSHSDCVALAAGRGLSPCAVGLVTARGAARPPWRDALAHHPDLPALRADVFRVAGLRLCAGCFTVYPAFAAALLATWLWPVPAAVAWTAGAALAATQVVSAAGWTRWRWLKVAVKACLGVGAALLLRAILAAPWEPWARSLAVTAGGLLALASAQPRRKRIARLQAAA
jgi:hypothetical protein